MKFLFLYLCAIQHLNNVQSQISLSLSAPALVRPSDTMTLICRVTGVLITDGSKIHAVDFIKEVAGHKFVFLAHLNYAQGTAYNSEFSSRLLLSRDTNKNEVYLQIKETTHEDTAIYYCAREYSGPYYFDYWGKGTLVTVTSEAVIIPHVYPLVPSGYGDSSSVTFGCLVDRYFPEPVVIAMGTTTGQTSSTLKIFPAVQRTGPNISYSRSSQLTVSTSDWSKNTYQCLVNHNAANFQKIIPKGCTASHNPTVKLFPGSCPGENNLKQVQLVCQMYNFTSQTIEVTWYVNGIETSLENKITSLGTFNGQFSFLCKVNVSQAQWNSGAYYKCQAKDTKTGKKVEDTVRKCSDNIDCLGINVFILRPTVEDIFVNRIAPLTCLASNIPSSTGYKFTWSQEGGKNLPFTVEDPTLNENGTYSMASVCSTTVDAWDKGTKYTCIFTYTGISSPYIKTISKGTEGNMSPPIVALFPPTSEEESSKEYVTYTCMASNFYPMDIYIGWSQDNQEIPKSLYVNSDPKGEVENASYFIVSKYKVPYEDWKENKAVSCVVGHVALPLHFIQRTIDITTGKPTKITVNVHMSDSAVSCP